MANADQPGDENNFFDNHRKTLVRLIVRITLYYIVVAGTGAVLLHLFPQLLTVMPIGGIVDYGGDPFVSIEQMEVEPGEATATLSWLTQAASLILAMTLTLIAMIPVAWLYKAIHEGHEYDHSIDETALVMPAVVAGVVTVAQQSLALAFSLAGIVAGVRFRRALSDTFDTLFIFVAIGVGLAAGVEAVEIAFVITVFFCYATSGICIFGDGLESSYVAEKEQRRLKMKNAARKKAKQKRNRKKKKADAAPPSIEETAN
ncbi:MAG: hypothetical protein KJN99_06840 [Marinicaulis sp.]|nr:hypothetical protein [Marinicaulis sp.]